MVPIKVFVRALCGGLSSSGDASSGFRVRA